MRAVELTTNNINDSQVFEDLLAQIALDEQVHSVYTDCVRAQALPTSYFRSRCTCSHSTK